MKAREYFTRISYKGSYENLDLETLTVQNLSIHCGETIGFDIVPIYNKIVRKKRGGWCMENNHLLFWTLHVIGYDVSIFGGNTYDLAENIYVSHINHILLKVIIDGKSYIVDGGFGDYLPSMGISGKDQPQTAGIFHFPEDNESWYFEKIKRMQRILNQNFSTSDHLKTEQIHFPNFVCLEPQSISDFQSLNS